MSSTSINDQKSSFFCITMPITKRSFRHLLAVGLACLIIISLMIFQLYSGSLVRGGISDISSIPDASTPPPSSPPLVHYTQHSDPTLFADPSKINDFCNNMPKAPKHPRGIFISHKPRDVPLKIFIWRQSTYMDPPQDWKTLSLDLCPFPPELQPFFDFYFSAHVQNNEKFKDLEHWSPGFAPCSLWTKPVGEWSWDWREEVHGWTREKIFSCGTNNLQYTITANYTEFREADIIYFDYPFYDYIGKPPFWDNRRMPPRIAHQKWVLKFGRESTAYYPQVALASYLQQFDFTMGAPDPQFDLSYPLYPVSEVEILQFANVKPVFPVDKKPENYIAWMISNCTPKNNRNEIMKELMEKIGAHSYGSCQNNRKGPSEEETKGRPWEQVKQEILAAYPFTLVAENSNCIGYITEKIYDAFAAGVVPLYIGAVDIADYVPRSSFVAIQDFEDVDSLVKYMKTVDRSQFFEWKEEVKKDYSSFCKKCHRGKETLECRVLDNVHHV